MSADLSKVGLLIRREIEARIAGPLIKAFIEEFGKEETMKIVEPFIASLARASGAELSRLVGGNSIEHFVKTLPLWGKDNAIQYVIIKQNDKEVLVNITRCRYSEMYKVIGMPELGYVLSCARDFEMVRGFNPQMRLIRKHTIMEGADFCDFHCELQD